MLNLTKLYVCNEFKQEQNILTDKSNRIGISLIAMHVGSIALTYAGIWLMSYLGFYSLLNSDNEFNGFDPIGYYLLTVAISILPAILPFIIMKKYIKTSINVIFPFERLGKIKLALIIFFGMGACMIANLMASSYSTVSEALGFPISKHEIYYSGSPVVIFLMIVANSVIPALVEETVFRGVILGSLRRYGNFFAIFTSATLFALMHNTLIQLPFAFSLGILFGFIAIKTNSLLPSILIHFANNFISTLSIILKNSVGEVFSGTLFNVAWAFFIITGFASFYYLNKKYNFFTIDADENILSDKNQAIKTFVKAPGMILATVMLCASLFYMLVNNR